MLGLLFPHSPLRLAIFQLIHKEFLSPYSLELGVPDKNSIHSQKMTLVSAMAVGKNQSSLVMWLEQSFPRNRNPCWLWD